MITGKGNQRRGASSHTSPREKKQKPKSRQQQAALPPIDERFRLAFDNAPIGIAIVGLDYRLQRVNTSLCEALGYSEEELLTRTLVEITHPDDIKRDKKLAKSLFRGEIPSYRIEKRFIKRDGQLVWLDFTVIIIRDAQNDPLHGMAMVENITVRKRAQEALSTSEERYRSFVVNSTEGIWRLEMEEPVDTRLSTDEQIEKIFKVAYQAECNDAMARMYGYERAEDMTGIRFSDIASPADPVNEASVRTFIANGYRLHDVETVVVGKEGRLKIFTSTVIGIVMNGYLLRVWGTQRDMTERKLAEDEVRRSRQQLRSLAARLQSIREQERTDIARELHDVLGQGLTGLKIDLSWLLKHLPESLDESVRAGMTERLNSATHLLEETILAAKNLSSDLRPGVLDKLGLAAAVEWQCQEFERRTGIKCQCHLPDVEVDLSAERSTALFRILQESLTNVARHSEAKQVIIKLKADDGHMTLSVRDDGQGLTQEQASAINSLGLLGMRERVELFGGEFSVEGKARKGTTITARMPLKDIEPQ